MIPLNPYSGFRSSPGSSSANKHHLSSYGVVFLTSVLCYILAYGLCALLSCLASYFSHK